MRLLKTRPLELIKTAKVEVRMCGKWVEIANIEDNITKWMKTNTNLSL